MLIGADGLWSRVRRQLLPAEASPRYSGILAYRALVPQATLPACLRSRQVTAWLGPDLHAVQYPVRGGSHLNVVIMIRGPRPEDLQDWDHAAKCRSSAHSPAAYGAAGARIGRCHRVLALVAALLTARRCVRHVKWRRGRLPCWVMPPIRCARFWHRVPAWRSRMRPCWRSVCRRRDSLAAGPAAVCATALAACLARAATFDPQWRHLPQYRLAALGARYRHACWESVLIDVPWLYGQCVV